MRGFLMILPLLIVAAGCADGPPPVPAAPQQGITASFPPGGIAGVIKIDALDAKPLRTAELVAPDGSTTSASSLDVDPNPQTIGGDGTIADPWRSSGFASNGINPLPNGPLFPTPRSRDQLLLMVSTADITLSDPVAYRRDWADYKIRLGFAAAGGQLETREIPAPAPPPENPAGS